MSRKISYCLAGCGKRITHNFAICRSCEKTYGRSAYEWPAWLRFLWNDVQREEYREQKIEEYEVPLSMVLGEDEICDDLDVFFEGDTNDESAGAI